MEVNFFDCSSKNQNFLFILRKLFCLSHLALFIPGGGGVPPPKVFKTFPKEIMQKTFSCEM